MYDVATVIRRTKDVDKPKLYFVYFIRKYIVDFA
jgi:hypothetical protein